MRNVEVIKHILSAHKKSGKISGSTAERNQEFYPLQDFCFACIQQVKT